MYLFLFFFFCYRSFFLLLLLFRFIKTSSSTTVESYKKKRKEKKMFPRIFSVLWFCFYVLFFFVFVFWSFRNTQQRHQVLFGLFQSDIATFGTAFGRWHGYNRGRDRLVGKTMDRRGIGSIEESVARARYQLAEGGRTDTRKDESPVQKLLLCLSEKIEPGSGCRRVLSIVGRRTETMFDRWGRKW